MRYTDTSAAESRRMRTPRVKTVIAISAFIIGVVCILILYQSSKASENAIKNGRQNAERLAQIMADQVQLTFVAVDQTMRRAVERQYFNLLFGDNLREDIENSLRIWLDETPQLSGLLLIGADGTTQVAAFKKGYQTRIPYRESFLPNPLFQFLKTQQGSNFAISSFNHPEEGNLITLAREVTLTNGEFGGMIMAVIDPAQFASFFASVDKGAHRLMALIQEDGTMLYTGPEQVGFDVNSIAVQLRDNYLRPEQLPAAQQTDTETYQDRLIVFSYKTLQNLPIRLIIAIEETDFLSEWKKARIWNFSFLAIFIIAFLLLTYFTVYMARQIIRVEESESAAILASQAKSEFLANMSHELRTPLNAIIGFSEMINAGYFGDLTDQQRERIHDIHLCGTHLLQLISDILEFSKGEAGKLELHEETMDLTEIMHECSRIISEKASGKHIKVTVDLPETLPFLRADKRKIRQILLNLLSNAVKFTPEQGNVTMKAVRDRHGQFILTVTDSGIGIPEEDIQKALSVFGQVHRNQSHEGTGLGLPLCKMFTELHGGRLSLASKVGHGTTVTVILPAERAVK